MKFMESITHYTNVHHTDISSHLEAIYKETYAMNPKIIVELGIRGAESSRVFGCITQELNTRLIGVDIDPPYQFDYNGIKNSTLILMDDVKFASIYKALVKEVVDVLFIDTSHIYEHTVQEIAAWFPLLGNRALVIFHDTNIAFHLTWNIALLGALGTAVIIGLSSYFSTLKVLRLDTVDLCRDLN